MHAGILLACDRLLFLLRLDRFQDPRSSVILALFNPFDTPSLVVLPLNITVVLVLR